ncbi:MAG: hypothetical protein O3C40_18975 [Planctomycetota bacterium]|nr:hypothetical protein [Planctomycetota bacterium]
MPNAAQNEVDSVEQPKTIVTHRRLEVNPKASAAWMRRLSGRAVLDDRTTIVRVSSERFAIGEQSRHLAKVPAVEMRTKRVEPVDLSQSKFARPNDFLHRDSMFVIRSINRAINADDRPDLFARGRTAAHLLVTVGRLTKMSYDNLSQ